jgi:hypothetical protein
LLAHALKEIAPPYFQLFFPGHAEFDHFNRS